MSIAARARRGLSFLVDLVDELRWYLRAPAAPPIVACVGCGSREYAGAARDAGWQMPDAHDEIAPLALCADCSGPRRTIHW